MADFSTITQDPTIRAIVQEGMLERAFRDALFPKLLFRGEATVVEWPGNVGDTMFFTGAGLITPKQAPIVPGTDPAPSSYQVEQWAGILNQYADSIDTAMPTSITAIANLFLRNAQQLGLSAGQSLNRIVRDRLYNAAESGLTVADGAQITPTTLRVKRLNGFTRARRPDLPNGSPVRFDFISGNNPLAVTVNTVAGDQVRQAISFTPDNPGDELGPGTITFSAALANNVADRAYVLSSDHSFVIFVGGSNRVDTVTNASVLDLKNIRNGIASLWQNNVPEMPDGYFHCHLDPTAQSQVFSSAEFQTLMTALPDYVSYRSFGIGTLLNTAFFRNSECPISTTVQGGLTATFSTQENFAPELFNNGTTTGVPLHRTLIVGQGSIYEYYQDLSQLITEAGITGRVGEPRITNNGIEVFTDRVQLVFRSPLNRLQDQVSTTWKVIADWPVRTDATSGGPARYKRQVVIVSGE